MPETMSQSKPSCPRPVSATYGIAECRSHESSSHPGSAFQSAHGFPTLRRSGWAAALVPGQGERSTGGWRGLSSSNGYLWGLGAQWRALLSLPSWEQTSSHPLSSRSVQKRKHVMPCRIACLQGQGGPPRSLASGGRGAGRWGCALNTHYWCYY